MTIQVSNEIRPADAVRKVALSLEQAIAHGKKTITAEDLLQTLLSIADEMDAEPPIVCPDCGSANWQPAAIDGCGACECGLEFLIA